MKCTRIPMEAEVTKYELGKGLEDGFELFSDIVTKGWIITDKLLKVVRDNGSIVLPRHKSDSAWEISVKSNNPGSGCIGSKCFPV